MDAINENQSAYTPVDVFDDASVYNVSLPTEDDLPCDDGEPMETPKHREQMNLLIDSLKTYWKEDKRYYTGGNMFLHFDLAGEKKFRGPDFFLVMDVDHRERKSWVVWQENSRFPDVIIELLSDTTRNIDKGEKKELYEQVFRTHEYYVYDPYSQEFAGYRLSGVRYHPILPDKEKKIFSPVTGFYLVVKDDWLRWMTEEGDLLPTDKELYEQEKQRADQEKQRAEKEKQRAEQVEKQLLLEQDRIKKLTEKLRALGISE